MADMRGVVMGWFQEVHDKTYKAILDDVEKNCRNYHAICVHRDRLSTLKLADKWPAGLTVKSIRPLRQELPHTEGGVLGTWLHSKLAEVNEGIKQHAISDLTNEIDKTKQYLLKYKDVDLVKEMITEPLQPLKKDFPVKYHLWHQNYFGVTSQDADLGNSPVVEERKTNYEEGGSNDNVHDRDEMRIDHDLRQQRTISFFQRDFDFLDELQQVIKRQLREKAKAIAENKIAKQANSEKCKVEKETSGKSLQERIDGLADLIARHTLPPKVGKVKGKVTSNQASAKKIGGNLIPTTAPTPKPKAGGNKSAKRVNPQIQPKAIAVGSSMYFRTKGKLKPKVNLKPNPPNPTQNRSNYSRKSDGTEPPSKKRIRIV